MAYGLSVWNIIDPAVVFIPTLWVLVTTGTTNCGPFETSSNEIVLDTDTTPSISIGVEIVSEESLFKLIDPAKLTALPK